MKKVMLITLDFLGILTPTSFTEKRIEENISDDSLDIPRDRTEIRHKKEVSEFSFPKFGTEFNILFDTLCEIANLFDIDKIILSISTYDSLMSPITTILTKCIYKIKEITRNDLRFELGEIFLGDAIVIDCNDKLEIFNKGISNGSKGTRLADYEKRIQAVYDLKRVFIADKIDRVEIERALKESNINTPHNIIICDKEGIESLSRYFLQYLERNKEKIQSHSTRIKYENSNNTLKNGIGYITVISNKAKQLKIKNQNNQFLTKRDIDDINNLRREAEELLAEYELHFQNKTEIINILRDILFMLQTIRDPLESSIGVILPYREELVNKTYFMDLNGNPINMSNSSNGHIQLAKDICCGPEYDSLLIQKRSFKNDDINEYCSSKLNEEKLELFMQYLESAFHSKEDYKDFLVRVLYCDLFETLRPSTGAICRRIITSKNNPHLVHLNNIMIGGYVIERVKPLIPKDGHLEEGYFEDDERDRYAYEVTKRLRKEIPSDELKNYIR